MYPANAPINITPSKCPSIIPDLSPTPRIPKINKSPAQISENGISLFIVSFATFTVAIIAHTPITTIRLNILEPTTLLTASSLLPVIDADTLTAVSGSDVPIATIVSPIIIDGTCSLFATLELPSTKKSAPLISRTKPIIRHTSTRANGALLMNFSMFSSFFSLHNKCRQLKYSATTISNR